MPSFKRRLCSSLITWRSSRTKIPLFRTSDCARGASMRMYAAKRASRKSFSLADLKDHFRAGACLHRKRVGACSGKEIISPNRTALPRSVCRSVVRCIMLHFAMSEGTENASIPSRQRRLCAFPLTHPLVLFLQRPSPSPTFRSCIART